MTEGGIERWDLTPKISPYLDRHMMFPLLEYLDSLINAGSVSYSVNDVAAARLSLLRPTHMVDYAIDIYKALHGDKSEVPKEMEEQRAKVYEMMASLEKGCEPFRDLCEKSDVRAKLMADGKWNIDDLFQSEHNITPDVIETYRQYAKCNFDCGDYQTSRGMLENYISLFSKPPANMGNDDNDYFQDSRSKQQSYDKNAGNPSMYYMTTIDENLLQVLWGKLACEILAEDWEAASKAVEAVKTAMELMVTSKKLSALVALSQRTWLLHWSLFVYWNNSAKGGLEQLVELFHTEHYKQAITTNAPHLIRYLTAAVLLCKRRMSKKAVASSNSESRWLMENLVNVMKDCEYTDPIVEFVNCLCVKFDFESAQTKLQECEQVLACDFFLCRQTKLFMEEARVFIFENYCRIHNKIDLAALGGKLGMNQGQAEKWIVDLIRNADLDAKIDSQAGCVVMGGDVQSMYEQVMNRTRDINVRSATLAQTLTQVLSEARKTKADREKAERDAME